MWVSHIAQLKMLVGRVASEGVCMLVTVRGSYLSSTAGHGSVEGKP